jgi:hypothetical protein
VDLDAAESDQIRISTAGMGCDLGGIRAKYR